MTLKYLSPSKYTTENRWQPTTLDGMLAKVAIKLFIKHNVRRVTRKIITFESRSGNHHAKEIRYRGKITVLSIVINMECNGSAA